MPDSLSLRERARVRAVCLLFDDDVQSPGSKVQSSKFKVQSSRFKVQGSRFEV
jgi:hypothetical protein